MKILASQHLSQGPAEKAETRRRRIKKLLFLIVFSASHGCFSQVISTFAGGGTVLGDGGPATAAMLIGDGGVVSDRLGNIYYADGSHNRIRKIDGHTGIITTFVGTGVTGFYGDGGLATNAKLNNPTWLAIDTMDNIYIDDAVNTRIRKVDAVSHIITTIVGNGIVGYNGDNIAATAANLNGQQGIAVDKSGNLFVVDASNERIRRVDKVTGIITTVCGDGTMGFSGDGLPATIATINGPYGICFDHDGNLFFSDRTNARVRRIDTNGIISTIAGTGVAGYVSDGVPATSAQLDEIGLVVSPVGGLLVADYVNNRIRQIGLTGIIQTVAGNGTPGYSGDGGPPTSAKIHSPEGLCYDPCGNLYIADKGNGVVRKITYPGSSFTPSIFISASPSDTVCLGATLSFSSTITGGGSLPSYQWIVNGVLVGSGASYSYTPTDGDVVNCNLVSSSPCATMATVASNTLSLTVDTITIPSIALSGLVTVSVGTTVTVNAIVGGTGSSYVIHWMNHGTEFTTTTVPLVTYTKGAGTDTITARIVPTGYGCWDSTLSVWHIVGSVTNDVPMLSPPGLMVYPNPVGGNLTVLCPQPIASYSVTSITGQRLLAGEARTEKLLLDIHTLPPAIYLLTITSADGQRLMRRIIKE